MPKSFAHLELNTPDLAKAKEFYGKLFDWSFHDHDMGPGGIYSVFRPDNGPGGGMMSMPGAPTSWLPYVNVDEIHAATEKARSLGAQVLREAQEVPGMGFFSILVDPTGATIAIWQSASA